ncbi:MAG TPA: ABC transporter permease, partial [Acidimicrobiales bacterium]|nr:ABC transporter permease [Acidimicrobiales bacterium]
MPEAEASAVRTGVGDGTGGLFAGAVSEVDAVGIRHGGVGGAGRRFVRDPRAVVGLVMVATVVLTAVLAPALAPFDPEQQDLTNFLQGPSWDHWLGTDPLGRDQLSRMVYGSRIAVTVGLASIVLATAIAVVVGSVAGYQGRRWDSVLMRVTEMFYAFPPIVGLIVIIVVLGRGIPTIVVALGLFGWATMARVLRASILTIREAQYVEAARGLGATSWWVVTRHVLPNSLGPLLVIAVARVATAILALAGLTFLGIGLEADTPDWGAMAAAGNQFFG